MWDLLEKLITTGMQFKNRNFDRSNWNVGYLVLLQSNFYPRFRFLRHQSIKTWSIPSRHLIIQNQQWKHYNDVWNLFKVNNRDTDQRQWPRSGVFIINFEQISHFVLVLPLLNFNEFMPVGSLFVRNISWKITASWNLIEFPQTLLPAIWLVSHKQEKNKITGKSNDGKSI